RGDGQGVETAKRARGGGGGGVGVAGRPGGSSAAARASVANDRRKVGTMADIRVPALGESVTEATIGKWFKRPGDPVAVDEPLVELETDKVTIEVPSPAAGVLADIAAKDGET